MRRPSPRRSPLLEGRFKEVKADLTAEMERAAEELRFERAAELRDRIQAIELLGMRQKVVAGSLADTDVTGFFRGQPRAASWSCTTWRGELAAKDMDLLETPMEEDEEEVLSSLVREYYVGRSRLPRQILLPCELPDQVPLTRMLSEQVGRRVELVTPQGGKDGSDPAGQPERGRRGGPGHHPGGTSEQAAGGAGQDAGHGGPPGGWSPTTSPTLEPVTSWPPWWSMWTEGP